MEKLIAIIVAAVLTGIGLSAWFFIIGFLFDSEMWFGAGEKVFIIGALVGAFGGIKAALD